MKHARLIIDLHYHGEPEDEDIEMGLCEIIGDILFDVPGGDLAGMSHEVKFFGRAEGE